MTAKNLLLLRKLADDPALYCFTADEAEAVSWALEQLTPTSETPAIDQFLADEIDKRIANRAADETAAVVPTYRQIEKQARSEEGVDQTTLISSLLKTVENQRLEIARLHRAAAKTTVTHQTPFGPVTLENPTEEDYQWAREQIEKLGSETPSSRKSRKSSGGQS